jgi:hypothetical protein
MHGTLRIGRRHPELELHESTTSRRARYDDRLDAPVLHGRSTGSCLTLLAHVETDSSTSSRDGYEEFHRRIMVGTVLLGDSRTAFSVVCRPALLTDLSFLTLGRHVAQPR